MTRTGVEPEERVVATPPAAKPAARPGGGRRHRVSLTAIVLFLLPALVLFTLLVLAPILVAGYASLYKWNGYGGLPTNFIGLDNFARMLRDKVFLGDLRHLMVLIL